MKPIFGIPCIQVGNTWMNKFWLYIIRYIYIIYKNKYIYVTIILRVLPELEEIGEFNWESEQSMWTHLTWRQEGAGNIRVFF